MIVLTVVVSCSWTILICSKSTALCVLERRISVRLSLARRLATRLNITSFQVPAVELLRNSLIVDYLQLSVLLCLVHFIELALV
jgi:hypothetical protein